MIETNFGMLRKFREFHQNFNFRLRIDFPVRDIPYKTEKLQQEFRIWDFNTNRRVLGNTKFNKVRKYKDSYDSMMNRIWSITNIESKKETHYHSLVHIPEEYEVKEDNLRYYTEYYFNQLGYKPLLSFVNSTEDSVGYNNKAEEVYEDFTGLDFKYFYSF